MRLKCKLIEVKFNLGINKRVSRDLWNRSFKAIDKSPFNSMILHYIRIKLTSNLLAKILLRFNKARVVIKAANILIRSMLMITNLIILIDLAQLQEVNCKLLSKKVRFIIYLICIVLCLLKSLMKILIIKAFLKELRLKSKLII